MVGHSDSGTPLRRKVTGRTQDDVRARLDELRRSRRTGLPLPGRRRTVRWLLEGWLEGPPGTVAVGSLAKYMRVVRLCVNPSVGARRLVDLTPGEVTRMLDDMAGPWVVRRDSAHARAVLRRALRHAEQQGWVARNVAVIADGPKVTRSTVQVLELDEARTLLSAAQGHRLEAAIVLALTLGLRRGELFGLTWADVALDDVSELAGHASVRVTKDCYGHMLEGGRQRAADAMQRALGTGWRGWLVLRSVPLDRQKPLYRWAVMWVDLRIWYAPWDSNPEPAD